MLHYLFNDNWSPRLGFNVDPFGNQKSKVFFNYARYQLVLPLDAAIRQLGNEQDDTNFYFTPEADSSGNAILDALGCCHSDDGRSPHAQRPPGKTATAAFGAPNFASSTGEGILPGTKMEYENEFVLGLQREVVPGSVLAIRYSDRRLGRIVEDIGSQSPEISLTQPTANYAGGIANVLASTDNWVNEDTVTYTPDQWDAANRSIPGD